MLGYERGLMLDMRGAGYERGLMLGYERGLMLDMRGA